MGDFLTCGICGRTGLQRLSKHLTDIHKVRKEDYLRDHPGAVLETVCERTPRCKVCGADAVGFSPRAVNVKCDGCRKAPSLLKHGEASLDRVPCLVCGVSRRMLTPHLASAHGMTREDYLSSYPGAATDAPGARTRSDACKQKMAEKAKVRWSSEDERKMQSIRLTEAAGAWRGKPLTKAHREAVSRGGKGKPHNITPEDRAARRLRGTLFLEAFRKSPDASEKLSKGVRRRLERGERWGFMLPKVHRKSLESRIRNGTLAPQGGGRGICGFRAGIPHYCRSTFEANFARILIHLGVPYNYEPKLFHLADGSYYTPDFYLLSPMSGGPSAGWVELKGWRHEDGTVATQAKIDAFVRETGQPVTVLSMRDPLWEALSSRYSSVIDRWETPGRNLKTHPHIFGLPIVSAAPSSEGA